MAEFNLAAMLNNVSNLDTASREQIEYINIDNVQPDPKNFYAMTGIDELAESIELLGLQQPIRVRAGESPDKVIIVSGHRRYQAMRRLLGEGKKQFASVPCIREKQNGSEALQQLRLIYANAGTRRLSSYELSEQAKQTEELFYQLSEEGFKFPGRMRDKVAEACKVSASRIARLKVIEKNLVGRLRDAWKQGVLNESCAYRLAREPEEYQAEFEDWSDEDFETVTLQDVEEALDDQAIAREVDKWEGPSAAINANTNSPEKPEGSSFASFDAEAYADQLRDENDKFFRMLGQRKGVYIREILRSGAENRQAGIAALKSEFGCTHNGGFVYEIDYESDPKGLEMKQKGITNTYIARTWTEVYDMLAIMALRESAKKMEARDKAILDSASAKAPLPSRSKWMTGKPSKSGEYIAKFAMEGVKVKRIAYFASLNDKWYFSKDSDRSIEMDCTGWCQLPEED